MFMLVHSIVLRVLFSKKGNFSEEKGRISEFSEIINELEELAGVGNIADSFPWMGWYNKFSGFEKKLEKNFRALDNFYDIVIQEHRQQSGESEHEDLADVLLRIQDDPNQEIRLTNDNINGVLMVCMQVFNLHKPYFRGGSSGYINNLCLIGYTCF